MARGQIEARRCAGWMTGLALIIGGLSVGGCAIHTQGPIREVAYDFSDRDFYDRAYAPSPKYLETDPLWTAVPVRAESATAAANNSETTKPPH